MFFKFDLNFSTCNEGQGNRGLWLVRRWSGAVARGWFFKGVFFEILQDSQVFGAFLLVLAEFSIQV